MHFSKCNGFFKGKCDNLLKTTESGKKKYYKKKVYFKCNKKMFGAFFL